ncbi:hypothetical protein QE152_g8568 [Popillia japonica]|uniref:Uncharacterized protein n=1 Tax=Popillia japonica TaxID=7064 RepID=A0AAW1LXL2_POPJA
MPDPCSNWNTLKFGAVVVGIISDNWCDMVRFIFICLYWVVYSYYKELCHEENEPNFYLNKLCAPLYRFNVSYLFERLYKAWCSTRSSQEVPPDISVRNEEEIVQDMERQNCIIWLYYKLHNDYSHEGFGVSLIITVIMLVTSVIEVFAVLIGNEWLILPWLAVYAIILIIAPCILIMYIFYLHIYIVFAVLLYCNIAASDPTKHEIKRNILQLPAFTCGRLYICITGSCFIYTKEMHSIVEYANFVSHCPPLIRSTYSNFCLKHGVAKDPDEKKTLLKKCTFRTKWTIC